MVGPYRIMPDRIHCGATLNAHWCRSLGTRVEGSKIGVETLKIDDRAKRRVGRG